MLVKYYPTVHLNFGKLCSKSFSKVKTSHSPFLHGSSSKSELHSYSGNATLFCIKQCFRAFTFISPGYKIENDEIPRNKVVPKENNLSLHQNELLCSFKNVVNVQLHCDCCTIPTKIPNCDIVFFSHWFIGGKIIFCMNLHIL